MQLMHKHCSPLFFIMIRMTRQSKLLTCVKKLECRVDKLRKECLASLVSDHDYFEVDNHLHLMHMVSHRKLEVVTSKRFLLRKKKHRKFRGECQHARDSCDNGENSWRSDNEFV